MPELYCQHCGIKLSPNTRNTRCPKNKDGFHHFQSKEKPIIKDINYNQQDISAPEDYENISEWKKVEASIPELSESEKDEDIGIKKNSKNYKIGENRKEYEDDSEDEDEISED